MPNETNISNPDDQRYIHTSKQTGNVSVRVTTRPAKKYPRGQTKYICMLDDLSFVESNADQEKTNTKTRLTEDTQFYIRFKTKPITPEPNNELNYVNFGGEWIRAYKSVSMLGVHFISEASWETNWFNKNPEILNMILTNDKDIAKEIVNHKYPEISFLAKEIVNNNYISISEDKIFENTPTDTKELNPIFDRLPNNLYLARRDYANESDRWRMLNSKDGSSLPQTAAATAEECMQKYVAYEEEQRKKWLGA